MSIKKKGTPRNGDIKAFFGAAAAAGNSSNQRKGNTPSPALTRAKRQEKQAQNHHKKESLPSTPASSLTRGQPHPSPVGSAASPIDLTTTSRSAVAAAASRQKEEIEIEEIPLHLYEELERSAQKEQRQKKKNPNGGPPEIIEIQDDSSSSKQDAQEAAEATTNTTHTSTKADQEMAIPLPKVGDLCRVLCNVAPTIFSNLKESASTKQEEKRTQWYPAKVESVTWKSKQKQEKARITARFFDHSSTTLEYKHYDSLEALRQLEKPQDFELLIPVETSTESSVKGSLESSGSVSAFRTIWDNQIFYNRNPSEAQVGDYVQAHFQALCSANTAWYCGRISQIQYDAETGQKTCDILYDDGDYETCLPMNSNFVNLLQSGWQHPEFLQGLRFDGRKRGKVKGGTLGIVSSVTPKGPVQITYMDPQTNETSSVETKAYRSVVHGIIQSVIKNHVPAERRYKWHFCKEKPPPAQKSTKKERITDKKAPPQQPVAQPTKTAAKKGRSGDKKPPPPPPQPVAPQAVKRGRKPINNKNDDDQEFVPEVEKPEPAKKNPPKKKAPPKKPSEKKKPAQGQVRPRKRQARTTEHTFQTVTAEAKQASSFCPEISAPVHSSAVARKYVSLKEIPPALANALQRNLNSSDTHLGGDLLTFMLQHHNQAPDFDICHSLLKLAVQGPSTNSGQNFFPDCQLLERAEQFMQLAMKRDSRTMERFLDAAGDSFWMDCVNCMQSQHYTVDGDELCTTNFSVERLANSMHLKAVCARTFLTLLENVTGDCSAGSEESLQREQVLRRKLLKDIVGHRRGPKEALSLFWGTLVNHWVLIGHVKKGLPDGRKDLSKSSFAFLQEQSSKLLKLLGKITSLLAWIYSYVEGESPVAVAHILNNAMSLLDDGDSSHDIAAFLKKGETVEKYWSRIRLNLVLSLNPRLIPDVRCILADLTGVGDAFNIIYGSLS